MINRFALAYREQQQLFLFDRTFLTGTLLKAGGLATLSARFVVQFFWNPAVAVLLTVALLGLGAWLLWVSVRRSRADFPLLPLCLIPFFFLAASLSENAMHFSVLTAWLCALAAFWGYTRIRRRRLLWGIVLTVAVYLAAGPAALLFALCAMVTGFFRKEWASVIYLPLALACGWAVWWMAGVPTLQAAWTPAFFFDLDTPMPFAHWVAWGVLPLTVALCEAVKNVKGRRLVIAGISGAAALVTLIPAFGLARQAERRQPGITYEYEYYAANRDWDGLVASCRRHEWMPHTARYLNLALAWQDRLLSDLFRYDQRGPAGLVMMSGDRGIETGQAHIMFAMGNMAGAQDIAFNTLNSTEGLCPVMLKMNAQIELMRGAYEVADKYLSLLEKAPHYRRWAREQRRFLHDDAAVEADPLLGNGRRGFPTIEGFSMFGSPLDEVLRVLDANPADGRAMQYALAYLLLSKDMDQLCRFVDRYFGTPALLSLPQAVQEAVLFYGEYSRNVGGSSVFDPGWYRSHGVTPQTERRFAAFQQASLANGGKAPNEFRGTFWYYLINTQI